MFTKKKQKQNEISNKRDPINYGSISTNLFFCCLC